MFRLWVLLNFKASTYTKVNGKIVREMVEEFSNGKMGQFMKDTGRTILLLDMED